MKPFAPAFRIHQVVTLVVLALLLQACAGPALRDDLEREPPTFSGAPADHGVLFEISSGVVREHGENVSGFHLLDPSQESLQWRLALIDSAVDSLAIQTYLWYPDASGKLILDRALRAAERGVRVRLIIDDLLTIGLDQAIFEIERHPNVDVRLFNPWQGRGLMNRAGEMVKEMERLNQRMHVKLMTVDGHAAVLGGRNLGDYYFGLSGDYNFHDLDVMGFGPMVRKAEGLFDHYWNSTWAVSAENLDLEPDPEFARERLASARAEIEDTPTLAAFTRQPRDWSQDLRELAVKLHPGRSVVVYDKADGEAIEQNVAATLLPAMGRAKEELLITNAYIIPEQPAIDFVRELTGRGVTVKILTNSLASHDVPAVNSHYKPWRDDFLRAGAELYEARPDPAIKPLVEVPPTIANFVGLHTKAFVVDREFVFIGSMNFDPRSVNINTENGIYIQSPSLARELAAVMERDMAPDNAWRVRLDADGKLSWTNSEETVTRQPARNAWQRVMDVFFKLFPKELY